MPTDADSATTSAVILIDCFILSVLALSKLIETALSSDFMNSNAARSGFRRQLGNFFATSRRKDKAPGVKTGILNTC